MSLFQRLFRKTTAQPVLPSDVLVSLLYSKLLALPAEKVKFKREYGTVRASFYAQLRADRWVRFQIHLEEDGYESFVSHPFVTTGSKPDFSNAEALTLTELPLTPTVRLLAEALRRIRATSLAMQKADEEANAQLAAQDLVNDLLGLPAPEEQLALGKDYPRAEAVGVAGLVPPQAKEVVR